MRDASAFEQLYRDLPERFRAPLLKDTTYELTGAWKFFCRLDASQPLLLHLPGYSALALSFARHVARVDVLGPSARERELLAEVAAAKSLNNVHLLAALEEIAPPYATIVLLPGRRESELALFRHLLDTLLARQTGTEEWWLVFGHGGRENWTVRGKGFLRRMLDNRNSETLAHAPRLCFVSGTLAAAAQASGVIQRLGRRSCVELKVAPSLASPKYVCTPGHDSPSGVHFQSFRAGREQPSENLLACFGEQERRAAFLERLLHHLNLRQERLWRFGRQYRVLPGGKVQVELRREGAEGETAALLKLPLIPQAALRLRENANALTRLARAPELSRKQRQLFPHLLAEGLFETQVYYLESLIRGRSLDQLPQRTQTLPQLDDIFSLWFAMQSRLTRHLKVTDAIFASVFGNLVRRMQEWLANAPAECERMGRVLEYWHKTFFGRELTLGLVHGDFSIKNIMIEPHTRHVTGLIDWDLADFFSIPLLDVLHFFVRLDARSFRDAPPVIALRLVRAAEGSHRVHFQRAVEHHGYRPGDWPAVVMLYWLFRQRGYLGSAKNRDPQFVRRQFSEVLDLFEREILAPRVGVVV